MKGESLVVVDVASGTGEVKAAKYRSCVESSLAVAACLITSGSPHVTVQ
jgi:hypothetical protein